MGINVVVAGTHTPLPVSLFAATGDKRLVHMPRRSAADVSIVPLVPGKGRPEPPKALDPIEARAWHDVVDALPGHWLDPAGQAILSQTATQIALGERLALRLRQMREAGADDEESLEIEAQLAKEHQAVLRATVIGLTSLRATPKSRFSSRDAKPRIERNAGAARPWEIIGRKVEVDGGSDPDS
jgi:hypothetical protein